MDLTYDCLKFKEKSTSGKICHEVYIKWRKTAQTDSKGQMYCALDDKISLALGFKTALDNWMPFFYAAHGCASEQQFLDKSKESPCLLKMRLFPKLHKPTDPIQGSVAAALPCVPDNLRTFFSQALIKAGIDNAIDTSRTMHAFRRGGLQYRFIYAPKRWTLYACRIWGGGGRAMTSKPL